MNVDSTSPPLISIVIPTYKRPALLKRAIASVYEQTYSRWELIVSDDEDGEGEAWRYLSKLADDDERVRIFKNTHRQGQVGNTNNALERAKGEWIKLLHDDDVLKPACLEELIRVSTLRKNIACITCEVERFVNTQPTAPTMRSGWPLVEVIPQAHILPTMYLAENTGGAIPSQKMIHRSVIDAGVRMERPAGLRWMVDSWFNAQIARCGDLLLYRKPLVEWHQGDHVTETSTTTGYDRDRELALFRELIWDMLKAPSTLPPLDVMKKMVLFQQAVWQFKRRRLEEAWGLLRRIDDWRAFGEFLLWGLHHLSKGRYARAKREVLARDHEALADLLGTISPSKGQPTHGSSSMTTDDSESALESLPANLHDERNGAGQGRASVQVSGRGHIGEIGRIVVLHSRLSGYIAACLKALKERTGAELLVVRYPPASNAPFDSRHFAWIDRICNGRVLSKEELEAEVAHFNPDVALMAGWFDQNYLAVARQLRKRGVPVIAGCDAQWTGSLRQQVGRLVAPWHLHTAIDVLWVSGERQRQMARRLGFAGKRCWGGYYACDWEQFADVYTPDVPRPQSFLFVGRYVPVKGLDTLIAAYKQYRAATRAPWSLICAGAGELHASLQSTPGVIDKGFVQPDQLPALMQEGGIFVLPSRREPWGVVVQEAAAAGLPLLCSTASGAAVHLVQDEYNGFLFEPEDSDHLAQLMARMTKMTPDRRAAMGRASHTLSKQFTPQRWARMFERGVTEWLDAPITSKMAASSIR